MYVKQTKDVMISAIKRYAEKNEVSNTDSQLIIFTDDNDNMIPKYKVLKQFKPLYEVTFNELLNKKIDFLQREAIITPFIQRSIGRLAKENDVSPESIVVMIHSKDNLVKDINLFLYVNHQPIKEITIDSILGEENL